MLTEGNKISTSFWVGIIFVLASVGFAAFLSPIVALSVVFALCHIAHSDFWFSLFSVNIKPEHFAPLILIAMLVFGKAGGKVAQPIRSIAQALVYIGPVGYWVMTCASSFNSPDPMRSLVLSLQILVAISPVFLLSQIVRDRILFERIVHILMMIGVCVTILGLIGWCLSSFLEIPNMLASSKFYDVNTRDAPNGLFNETNLYAVFGLSSLGLMLPRLNRSTIGRYLFPLLFVITGLVVSQTRIVWIVTPMVLAIYFAASKHRFKRAMPREPNRFAGNQFQSKFVILPVFVLTIGVILLFPVFESQGLSDQIYGRIGSFSALEKEANVTNRLLVDQIALTAFSQKNNILLGLGAGSFMLRGPVLGGSHDWIGNVYIAAMHDGGILSLLFLLGGWISIVLLGWKSLGDIRNEEYGSALMGVWLASCGLLLTGMSNNVSWMVLYWAYYGLLAVGIRLHAVGNMLPNQRMRHDEGIPLWHVSAIARKSPLF